VCDFMDKGAELFGCCLSGKDSDAASVDGIDMRSISTVIPLIVTRDEFGGYMGVNTYLNDRFEAILGKVRYRKSVTSLICICADSLEKLSPYLHDTRLSDLLSVRLRGDKTVNPILHTCGSLP
jgi:hypothetical protein